jgi:hypothetical protein
MNNQDIENIIQKFKEEEKYYSKYLNRINLQKITDKDW